MKIFTFWEPKDKLPGYLELCLESWKKYIKDCEIVMLDYSNLDNYLNLKEFDKAFSGTFSLTQQSDAIRCAILNKHGGLWLDCDTIITSDKINDFLNTEKPFTLIGNHICFIKAEKDCSILNEWEKEVQNRITESKKVNLFTKIFHNREYKKIKSWDYFGNSILSSILNGNEEFYSIDKYQNKIFPEQNYQTENNIKLKATKNYRHFYFYNDFSEYALQDNCGIICLHNSWTPEIFREMTKSEFLEQKNTLSGIFKTIL